MKLPAEPTVDDVLYRGFRDLRELGHQSPGISLEREAMRKLGLLDDSGVATGHQIRLTIYENGRFTPDLQIQ